MGTNPPGTITLPTVVTAYDVETRVIAALVPRLSYYVQQFGYSTPKSIIRRETFDKENEDQLPTLVVVCPGLAERPQKLGREGTFTARWLVGVGVIVSARKEEEARRMARVYGAMIRAVVLQQPSLGGFARGVDWQDESYNQLEVEKHRSLSSAEVLFHIEVEGVLYARELPYMPDMLDIPTPSGYTADEVVSTVQTMGGS